jgi:hypothetical protein
MLRMIDRHAVQQMLTAGVRIGEVARHFEVSRRTIERPQGAGGRGGGGRSGLLEARGRAATCAGQGPGADAGAHRGGPGGAAAGSAAPAPGGGAPAGGKHVLPAAPGGAGGLHKELMVRFEGVAGDSSGSGTSDSRDGAYAATPSVSIPSAGWRMGGRCRSW